MMDMTTTTATTETIELAARVDAVGAVITAIANAKTLLAAGPAYDALNAAHLDAFKAFDAALDAYQAATGAR